MNKRNNIVDIIKFLAAILVIFSHSHSLSNLSKDIVTRFVDGVSLGSFAVAIFFTFSGYFIMRSLMTKGDKGFIKNRIKRILPELIIVVTLTVLIVGPLFTSYSVINYFFNINTYKYFLNAVMIPYHFLPGVFTNNIYGSTVNGALWTIPVEFCCYIFLFICYKLGIAERKRMMIELSAISIVGYFALHMINSKFLLTSVRPVVIFIYSATLYYYNKISKDQITFAVIISVILLLLKNIVCYNLFLIIFLPIIIIYIIKNINVKNKVFAYLGDLSYPIYLVGFVVQQSIVSIFGGTMNVYVNFSLTVLIAIILAIPINYLSKVILKRR